MKYKLIEAEIKRGFWAIEPNYGQAAFSMVARRSEGEQASESTLLEMRAGREAAAARQQAVSRAAGGSIAVIPLRGIIVQRANMVSDFSGGTGCQQFTAMLRDAVADDSVSQVLVSIDSPGGSVFGVSEAASEIMQLRTQKPIIGIADAMAASAAYWLGACCTELYVTPSGEVGSIGVWQAHTDESEAMKAAGLKTTLVFSGKHKTEGNSFGPLDPEARGFMQQRSDDYYRSFCASVARGRGVPIDAVRNGMGQGRLVGAQEAVKQKMADGIASIDDVIAGMQRNIKTGNRGAMALPGRSAAAVAHSARTREIEILEAEGGTPARKPTPRVARMRAEIAAIERNR